MRAAILRQLNEDMEVRDDVAVTPVGPGEVRVRIIATGVCHSDLSLQNGTIPHALPAVAGHEGAGEVVEVGPGVGGMSVGDHVIIAWIPPCGICKVCISGQPYLCIAISMGSALSPRFTINGGEPAFGMAGTGTFAEELVVPAAAAVPVPKDVPLDVAALIGCGVMTGAGAAINTAKVRPGSSVVVFGCGGVGLSVIQGARISGAAEIVAVDTLESKFDIARRFGATHAVTPSGLNAVSGEVTGGEGFDYAFEVVGHPDTIRGAFDATRRGGSTIVVGVGRMEQQVQFSAFELFFSEKTLRGSLYGSADVRTDFARLLRLWRADKLDLEGMITQRVKLEQVNEAFDALKRGEVIRTVIEMG